MTCINTILYIAHGSSEIVVVFLSKLIFLADNVLKVGGSGCPTGRPESNIARACCLNHRTRGSTDLLHQDAQVCHLGNIYNASWKYIFGWSMSWYQDLLHLCFSEPIVNSALYLWHILSIHCIANDFVYRGIWCIFISFLKSRSTC